MRLTVLFCLLFAGTAVMSSPFKGGGSRKGGKSNIKAAKEHMLYEEYHDAIISIEDLLKDDPSSAYYNFWMGKCLYMIYQKNQALPYFEKAEKANPDIDKEFHHFYALTLHYNLLYDRAIKEYKLDLQRFEPGSEEYKHINNRISQCLYAKKLQNRSGSEQVKIENMGDKINTPFSEHSPVISENDSILIYTARRPESLGAQHQHHYYDEDIYVARKDEQGNWSKGENIGKPVNSTGHDATISLSSDGNTLYLYRHKKQGHLYKTDFNQTDHTWQEPNEVEKPLNSRYYEASICESADKQYLFFSSDRPGGFGGLDIYMVKKAADEKSWDEPINLGPSINSSFDEDSPFFHPDGKTLYYSSDGPGSMGGFDIFVTEMADSSGKNWLDPLNMGPPVNTTDDDIYFVLSGDGRTGYYSSGAEGGYGEKDLYSINFPYYPYPRRYHIIELAGTVQDVNTLDTLHAFVKLIDNETSEVIDSMYTQLDSAKYFFMLEPERAYSLQVSADGYNVVTAELSTPKLDNEDVFLKKNLFVDKPGEVIPLPPLPEVKLNQLVFPEIQHIYYDFDESGLREDAKKELDLIAEILTKNEDLSIEILAHTDWYGTYTYNVKLSVQRANAAKNYLEKVHHIDDSRIKTASFSENRPIEDNDNDTGRQYNRRSEFRIIKDGDFLLRSVRQKPGSEEVYVDHTAPKGEPGFDNPEQLLSMGSSPENGELTSGSGNETEDGTKIVVVENDSKVDVTGGENNSKIDVKDISTKIDVKGDENKVDVSIDNTEENAENSGELILADVVTLDLKHIYFDFDRSDIRADAVTELEKLVDITKKYPELKIEITGNTDNYGSDDYNVKLSERRARSAHKFLLDHGMDTGQVKIVAKGESDPLSENDSDKGRQLNRRVEFSITYNGELLVKSSL